uniref:Transferrin receptor protein 1 n=1 Tax=Denticeps clupeoides TaxID=299321 RepID=A0AAY4ARX8_9TELE
MAATIDQARSTIARMFNGEPRSYTRFNLAQNAEDDASHVEVKLPSENDEDNGNFEDGPAQPRHVYHSRPWDRYKNLCYMAVGILLLFIIGYLVGYVSHRRPKVAPCESVVTEDPSENIPLHPSTSLDWGDLKRLLSEKLSAEAFDRKFSDYGMDSHDAGSSEDEILAVKVKTVFEQQRMNPWTDQLFVKVQAPPLDTPTSNKIMFGSDVIGTPQGYLAYSATGTKQGRVVYANYGLPKDLEYLVHLKINLDDCVVLLRAGKISYAEKVANVAKHNAAAVLIYPDPSDYDFTSSTELYGHVHLGSGDPYTPGFPSFNHTQFPRVQSSGLPTVLAQTITADMAVKIFLKMTGGEAPSDFIGKLKGLSTYKLGSDQDQVTVTVSNALVEKRIHNVFGVIKGFIDSDRYVVIGAQRDSQKGPGFAKSTVGTALLVELARGISEMVNKDGFRPRRSLVFASWSAGDYGSIGATEWLEGYLSSLHMKAFTYISLDGVIRGHEMLKASASPLLFSLLEKTMKEVTLSLLFPLFSIEPMIMEDPAYPFLAFSGIPSISFRFVRVSNSANYPYFGTILDNKINLDSSTSHKLGRVAVTAAQLAGQMALTLVHDHLLMLDVNKYKNTISSRAGAVNDSVSAALIADWLTSATGSYRRAANDLSTAAKSSDLENVEACRILNDRYMKVEYNFLSPYVSPKDVPFRHILWGSGDHTLAALLDHLTALKGQTPGTNLDKLRNQLALATWTIQACANDLMGPIWEMQNEI